VSQGVKCHRGLASVLAFWSKAAPLAFVGGKLPQIFHQMSWLTQR
jgi:hypothetical protein